MTPEPVADDEKLKVKQFRPEKRSNNMIKLSKFSLHFNSLFLARVDVKKKSENPQMLCVRCCANEKFPFSSSLTISHSAVATEYFM